MRKLSFSQRTIYDLLRNNSELGRIVSHELIARKLWHDRERPKTWRVMISQEVAKLRKTFPSVGKKILNAYKTGYMYDFKVTR